MPPFPVTILMLPESVLMGAKLFCSMGVSSGMNRRELLRLGTAGLALLAGCSEQSDSSPGTGTTSVETTNPTTETPTSTETPTETVTEPSPGSWGMYSYDVRNAGYNPETSAPTEAVETQWEFDTDGAVRSSPAVVDGTVYIGSDDGTVYAIDAETGQERWTYPTEESIVSSPAVFDNKVYVGSTDHYVYALSTEDGENIWQYETGDQVQSSPTVDTSRDLREFDPAVVIGSDDGSVSALNAVTGDLYDTLPTGSPIRTVPAINYYGTLEIFFGSADGNVYNWEVFEEPEPLEYDRGAPVHSSIAVAANPQGGEFPPWFFGTDDGTVYRDELYSANEWEFETEGEIRSSPALAFDMVYVGSWDGTVYAINAQGGELQWSYETDGKVDTSPAVADGTIYIGSDDQSVYSFDAETGDLLWNFQTGGEIRSSPTVSADTVYVGSNDNTVYALTLT